MTDLERVREILLGSEKTGPYEGVNIIDAHLKEDAEKAADALAVERQLHEKWAELEAENAKLREAYRGMGYLREDYARLLDKKWAADREVARLREELDLKDGLLNQAKGELTRLCEERDDARTQRDTALAVVELAEAQRDALLAALRFETRMEGDTDGR